MARHAFSLSDALAMQYCDPGTSTSRAPKSALAEHRPSTVARCDDAGRPRGRTSSKEAAVAARLPPSRRRIHRLPALTACVLVGLASLLPCSTALFDPGEPAPPPAPQIVSTSTSSNDAIPTNALVASSGPPISLPPGCRRTTDLFSDVCQNPWSGGAVRGDLVICPLPDVKPLLKGARMGSQGQGNVGPAEEGTGEQIFAVSGTVTIKYQDGAGDAGIPGQARLGQGQPENGHVKEEPGLPQDGGASLPNFPAEGDEGYWRQRDGQQEWQPVEPDPLMNPTKEATDPQGPAQQDEAALSSAHARAYDAWTAEMGNESGAASFLSFSEWREKHLAAEKERERKEAEAHEKNRMHGAKGRKGEKAKEKAKGPGTTPSGDKAAQSQARTDRTASTTGNEHPTEVSGSPSSARTRPAQESDDLGKATANVSDSHASASEAELAAGSSKDETLGLDDVFGEGVNPDFLSAATLENLHSGEGAASQDQVDLSEHYSKNGDAIPALANPKARLAELKHRWNFASFDCAAVVHRSNPSARFTSAILSEKKDRYMLSPCPTDGEGQFVVVELCDEIMIDTVVLANYEFFSRMFKRFRVRVARNLQGKEDEWFEVGTFRARNVRGLQVRVYVDNLDLEIRLLTIF